MTPRQANVLTGIGLVALLVAVALTAPRWSGLLREPAVALDEESLVAGATPAPGDDGEAERRISVRLYFVAPESEGLVAEERTIAFSDDLTRQVRTLVEELIRGPESGLLPTVPAGTRVLEVFLTARGVAYVNLSGEATSLPGGSRAELHTVYSVVNSIVTNFPAVRRVQILVEDRMVASLGGHIDLSRPLPADMTLVVVPSVSPEEVAGAEAGGAPAAAGPTT
jgi:spore germination protein GerM